MNFGMPTEGTCGILGRMVGPQYVMSKLILYNLQLRKARVFDLNNDVERLYGGIRILVLFIAPPIMICNMIIYLVTVAYSWDDGVCHFRHPHRELLLLPLVVPLFDFVCQTSTMVLLAAPLAYTNSTDARRALIRNTVASVLALVSSMLVIAMIAAQAITQGGADSKFRINLLLLDGVFNFAIVMLAASRTLREQLCPKRREECNGGEGVEEEEKDHEGEDDEEEEEGNEGEKEKDGSEEEKHERGYSTNAHGTRCNDEVKLVGNQLPINGRPSDPIPTSQERRVASITRDLQRSSLRSVVSANSVGGSPSVPVRS
mmetsp:Transcript_30483/g.58735  ORF Transcript_30483/g.58735 Transcript_30483/m.58735 type:complete len:316 (-) Transcript_30483:149-1096(-)